MQPRPITANDAASSSANGVGSQKIISGTPTVGSTVPVRLALNQPVPDVVFQFSGTFTGAAEAELSFDGGQTWGGPCTMNPVGGGNSVTSMTAPGIVSVSPGLATNARARATSFSNGSMNVAISPGIPPALPGQTRLQVQPGVTSNLLIWGAIPGATSYNIYEGSASGAETLLAAAQAGPTYNHTGLTANTTHYYYVTVVGPTGEGAASNEVVGVVKPSAPTSLGATGSASQIALAWTAPSGGAVSYNIYRGLAAGAEGPIPIANTTAVSYNDTQVSYGTAYYYVVKAVNAGGESVASNEVNATATGQAAPTSVAAAGSGSTTIDLTWVAAAGATTYNLYRGTSAGNEAVAPVRTGLTGTSFTDTGLVHLQTYYYKMTALSSVGQSVKSNEASATAGLVPAIPTAPTSPSATPGTGVNALAWTDPVAAPALTSRTVYRSLTTGTEASFATGIAGPSYVDQSCVPAVTYYYKETATNALGESPKSVETSATVTAGIFTGTFINTPTYAASVQTAISKFGYSLGFVAADSDGVGLGGIVANDLQQLTVCARFKTTTSGAEGLVGKAYSGKSWNLAISSGQIVFAALRATGDAVADATTSATFNDGAWHDVTVLVDGLYKTPILIYVDGVLAATGPGWDLVNPWNSADLTAILVFAFSEAYTGSLSDIRIYDTLLTSPDRSAYHAGTPVSIAPIGWWKCNENAGTTTIDSGVSWLTANVVEDGNSLTAGAHINTAAHCYPTRVGAMMASTRNSNVGVSGLDPGVLIPTTEGMVDRFPTLTHALYNHGYARNIIIAWEGINSMDAPYNDTPAQAAAAMDDYVALAQAGGFQVIVLTAIKCSPSKLTEPNRATYNSLILANTGGADLVYDLGAQPEFQDITDLKIYNADQIHLAVGGAAAVTRHVMQAILLLPNITRTPPAPPTVRDNFGDADDTDINGKAPDVGSDDWAVLVGTLDVQNHKMNCAALDAPDGQAVAVIESGLADCTIVGRVGLGSDSTGIVFRATDLNNFFVAVVVPSANTFYLLKCVAGSFSTVTSFSPDTTLLYGLDYSIQVLLDGSDITCICSGVKALHATDGFNATATKHGFRYGAVANTGDNFQVWPLP